MFESKAFRVMDESGFVGTLYAPARFLDNRTEKIIKLDGGGELSVRAEDLKVQQDGTFLLLRRPQSDKTQQLSVSDPVSEIAASGQEPPTPRAIEPVTTQANSSEGAGLAAASYYSDDYEIERIPVGRIVDVPAESRQEGDTLILPVMEEVLVYQKKMLLKEEVRITRRRKPVEEVRRIDQAGVA